MGRPPQNTETQKAKAFWPSARRLAKLLGTEKLAISVVVILVAVSVALNIAAPLVLGAAVDIIFEGSMNPQAGIDFTQLARMIGLVVLMYGAASLFSYFQALIINGVGVRLIYRLRKDIERTINRLPLKWFDTQRRGDVLSRTTNDVDNINQVIQHGLAQIINGVLTVVGIAVIMFVISWQLALIAMIAIPISTVVVGIIGSRSQKLFTAQWKHTGRLNAHIEEAFTGHELVTLFGREQAMAEEFDTRNEQLYQASFKAQFYSGMIQPIMEGVNALGYVGVAVVGGLQVATGRLNLGAVTAFIQYSREFNAPLGQLTGMANMVISAVASAERIFELLDAEPETAPAVEDGAHVVSPEEGARTMGPGEDRPIAVDSGAYPDTRKGVGAAVEFENVNFSYNPDTPLLTNLNLKVKPGQLVAIVGPTGAGKTTLVNLLMRFYELDSGVIRVNGTDITELPRTVLRNHTGMVLQDAVLFNGSIRDNIRYGNLTATDEQVQQAAIATYVDRFVATLANGYDTQVGLDTDALSAGQRQLVTIARAFLSNPELLILDEATSSVDTRTEKLIQDAMAAIQAQRTTFVIAHRLSTIRSADVIIVMEAGQVVEQGTHEQLLAAQGAYHRLYHSQFSVPEDPGQITTPDQPVD